MSESNAEYWLTVDLSSPEGGFAIHSPQSAGDPKLIAHQTLGGPFKHSEQLIPKLDGLLKSLGLEVRQFTRFIGPIGPGSFTGLRIGLATLKAFATVNGAPLGLLSSSEARAKGWMSNQHSPAINHLTVITHVGTQRMVEANFEIGKAGKFSSFEEKTVDVVNWKWWKREKSEGVILLTDQVDKPRGAEFFPSEARYFASAFVSSSSSITAKTPSEIAILSPTYFGSR